MSAAEFDPKEFGAAFQRFIEWFSEDFAPGDGTFQTLLTDHFGTAPSQYPITTESLGPTDLPNLQLATAAYLAQEGVTHEVIGFGGPIEHADLSLSALVHDQAWGVHRGPVQRRVVELDRGEALPCVILGLYLITTEEAPVAVLVAQSESHFGAPGFRLEVMAPGEVLSQRLVADLRTLMDRNNVYRGKVLALDGGGEFGEEDMALQFRVVPAVAREDIVLPDGVLDTVDLHTVTFAEHAEALLASGRHLRRGLLLHGPPGTGKTLTVSYLIGRLEGRTVIILSGGALGLVAEACQLAKQLAPSMIVLEDVDLVAQERMMGGPTSLLFELMNQIDGVGPDTDVIFCMTTNRADLLEPALAARPGRVDQAVAIPLPDAEARRRLLALYLRGIDASLTDPDPVIDRTDGVSAAFIRELVRKAALLAARDGAPVLRDEHLAGALDMLERGGSIMRAMLGGDGGAAAERLGSEGGWTAYAEFEEEDDWDDDE